MVTPPPISKWVPTNNDVRVYRENALLSTLNFFLLKLRLYGSRNI